jgi:hypothetical protein
MFNQALIAQLHSVVFSVAESIVEGEKIGRRVPTDELPRPTVCWKWDSCQIVAHYARGDVHVFILPPDGGEAIGGRMDPALARKHGFTMTDAEIATPAEQIR